MARFVAGAAARLPRSADACVWGLLALVPCGASETPAPTVAINRPAVGFVFPLSVQAGQATDVTLGGSYLDRARRITCECTDLKATIRSGGPLNVQARVEASDAAMPGPRFLVVETPKGPSNRILFRVTGWPSIVENEPNESREQAQTVPTPAIIEGKIATVQDSDMFRFHADAGERLAFNVLSARSGARGHVATILMTAEGRVVDRNLSYFGTDPYLDHTFDEAGDYVLTIIPRRFSDFFTVVSDSTGINWQYELAIGRSPILRSLFPMGGQRGTRVDVELRADFLDAGAVPRFSSDKLQASLRPLADPCECLYKLAVDIAADAPLGTHYLDFEDASGTLMPLAFAVSDIPEVVEREPNDGLRQGQPVSLPVVVNGRIGRLGDRDGVVFTVDQYDEIAFEVDATGLGSHMTDPNVALVRPDGELIARGDDRCTACGPYFGTVRKKDELDPKFWHYFRTGNPNDADAAGDYVLQLRDNAKRGGPDHTYRLTVRDKLSDFRVGVLQDSVVGPLDGTARIPVILRPEEGFKGAVDVRVDGLPTTLRADPIRLRTDEPSGTLEIRHELATLKPDKTTGWVQARVRIVGTAKIGGRKVVRAAELPSFYAEAGAGYVEEPRDEVIVSFVEPPQFSLRVEPPFGGFRIDLSKGGRVDVPVVVARAEGFEQALDFRPVELPAGLRLEAGPEEEGVVRIALIADPEKLSAGPKGLVLRASAMHEGVEVTEVTRAFSVQVK